jgi:outer membrane protein
MIAACCGGAETQEKATDRPSVYVGGGAIINSKPYVGADARVYPMPLFAYEGKRLYFRGITGGYWLYTWNGVSVGPILQPRFDGFEEDDSSALRGMDDRDWSVDGGLGLSWLTDIGLFGLSFVTDLLGRHDGQELEFSYTMLFEWGGFDFIPSTGVRWKSENLVDYYYGVRPDEARFDPAPARLAYDADNAVDPYIRLAVRRKLVPRWSLLMAAQYEWLGSEITDSPIVDKDYDASFLLGLLYTW